MEKIWVVAADNVHARIFQAENITGPLHEVRDMLNPQARLQDRELLTDAPGRTFSAGGGSMRRHAYEQRSEKDHQSEQFARSIVEEIEKLRGRGELERVHVLAEPGFLGRLREHYSAPLQKCIASEVGRRVTQNPPEKIRELLPHRM